MPVYLHAHIKLYPNSLQEFRERIATLLPIQAKHGWKLLGSYSCIAGRLDTVLDFWELPSTEALEAALSDPEFGKFAEQKKRLVEDEILTIYKKIDIRGAPVFEQVG